ncbi:unnamed protein product [Nezara viridula]|uniref:Uncharacterized protein n=1 Tax=Nezara viridula TaxID=85310 RepID=A0A9P0HA77_NEZVI|nr:unnamed protein product [Nezara viridula]
MVEELRADLEKFNTDIRHFILQNQRFFEETKQKIDSCSTQLNGINQKVQIRNNLINHSKSVKDMRKNMDNYLKQLSEARRILLENIDKSNLSQYNKPSTIDANTLRISLHQGHPITPSFLSS